MIVTERSLLDSLQAYINHFEAPNSREDLFAIASSTLTFQQKQASIAIAPNQAEALIQQVVDKFKVESGASVIEATTDKLVQEVNQWQQSLESQVLNTLKAYAQKVQPENILTIIPETILSILPLVENTQLRKVEVESLIQQVKSKFSLTNALAQVIDPESLANAERLVHLLKFENLKKLLQDSLLGNDEIERFKSSRPIPFRLF
jgi:phosphomevalonate kinase